MTIVFNLLCKAFIAILDILLLDFYLKNVYPDIYQKNFIHINKLIYFIIFILICFTKNIINYFFIQFIVIILLIIILFYLHINKIDCIKKLILFFILKLVNYFIVFIFFEWLFNTEISTIYFKSSLAYITLTHIVSSYTLYVFYFNKFNNNSRLYFNRFKIFSIITLIYFSLTFLAKNPLLFRIVSIGRTYIFTVVISIIALICFDRMQTKYEKDKHLQESIIQNLEKEKEFNQQREQQQKEIRKINHNLNNILIILQSHLEKEEYEEAKDYIEQNLKTHVEAYQALTHTGIAAIDGALNAHIQSIKEKGIQYDEDISKILHLGSIVPGDLALIISLALDNAKEACENIDDEKHISLKLQSKQTHVILYIENSIPEGSHPTFHKTSKKDKIAHGFGVSSIKEMAERYHGEAKYEVKHDQVILRVVLQK